MEGFSLMEGFTLVGEFILEEGLPVVERFLIVEGYPLVEGSLVRISMNIYIYCTLCIAQL